MEDEKINIEICNLFPVPIMKVDFYRDFTEKELNCFNSAVRMDNTYNKSSTDKNILNHPDLKEIKFFIEENQKIFFNLYYGDPNNVEIYTTQSWLNFSIKGQSHHEHLHPNSIISGVFYINVEGEDQIHFKNPHHMYQAQLAIEAVTENAYSATNAVYMVKDKNLILFPSTLIHKVPPFPFDATRISLSFNTFVKGYLGSKHDANLLILK